MTCLIAYRPCKRIGCDAALTLGLPHFPQLIVLPLARRLLRPPPVDCGKEWKKIAPDDVLSSGSAQPRPSFCERYPVSHALVTAGGTDLNWLPPPRTMITLCQSRQKVHRDSVGILLTQKNPARYYQLNGASTGFYPLQRV